MGSKAKGVLRRLLFPIYGYFEPRFQGLHEHLDRAVMNHADRRFNSIDERLMAIHRQIDATTGRVVADVQTSAEFSATFRRATEQLHSELRSLRALVADGRPGTAAAIAVPYVYAATAGRAPGSRILDLGACEATVGWSLASLGHAVTVVGPNPPPLHHPGLRHVVADADWHGPEEPQDVVVRMAAVDRATVERVASWLTPGGELVLTVPASGVRVDELLAGWTIVDQRELTLVDGCTWVSAGGGPASASATGVLLLRANPPG
jgi:hypothetical protein